MKYKTMYSNFSKSIWGLSWFIGWTVYLFIGVIAGMFFFIEGSTLLSAILFGTSLGGYSVIRVIEDKWGFFND